MISISDLYKMELRELLGRVILVLLKIAEFWSSNATDLKHIISELHKAERNHVTLAKLKNQIMTALDYLPERNFICSLLIFKSRIKTGDYHSDMNSESYGKWLEQLTEELGNCC